MLKACDTISKELEERLQYFKDETKLLEYERLEQRTRHDVEMLREVDFPEELVANTTLEKLVGSLKRNQKGVSKKV